MTEADYASNELIVSTLNTLFPTDGIVSEEIENDGSAVSKSTVWIIDPLDGTQSFIDGKDDFSILIARAVNQVVTDAVLYFPAMEIMAIAKRGAGAFINGEPIQVSPSDSLRSDSVYIRNFQARNEQFAYPGHMDSGRAFLAVARGDIDGAVMKMGRHKEWDLAAPSLLIEEAGGAISDDRRKEVLFNCDGIQYTYFLASNSKTHEQLFSLLPEE